MSNLKNTKAYKGLFPLKAEDYVRFQRAFEVTWRYGTIKFTSKADGKAAYIVAVSSYNYISVFTSRGDKIEKARRRTR